MRGRRPRGVRDGHGADVAREPDYTEGDQAYEAVQEIQQLEGPDIRTRMSKELESGCLPDI